MSPTNATAGAWPRRLREAVLGIASGTVIGWFFMDATWEFLLGPAERPGTTTGVPEEFLSQLKLSLIFGLVVASPIWLYQLFAVIAPRLHGGGRRWSGLFLAGAILLFVIGGIVAVLTLRHGLQLSDYGSSTVITFSDYIDQAMARLLVFGAAVELPLLAAVMVLERRGRSRPT